MLTKNPFDSVDCLLNLKRISRQLQNQIKKLTTLK